MGGASTATGSCRAWRPSYALAAALLLAACGGGDDDDGSTDPLIAETPVPAGDPVDEPTGEPVEGHDRNTGDSLPPVPDLGPAAGWTDSHGSTLLFTDVTEAAGVDVRFESALDVELVKDTAIMMSGAGAGDFDGDGDIDLFVLGGGVERDSLFLNDGAGAFTDVTVEAGLEELHLGSGVAVGDYDDDGDLDIFVTSHGTPEGGATIGAHRLYRNDGVTDGAPTFTDVAEEAGVATSSQSVHDGLSAVFGDIDIDGDLDLFVAGWQRESLGNRLFENQGDGTFVDVTDAAGIVDDGIRGFTPCIADMSGDRHPEILLVADFGSSRYFANDGEETPGELRFSEMTARSGAGLEWAGMGSAVGDVNNDGRLDWYTTAIFDADDVGRGTGNRLYMNLGPHTFEERAEGTDIADGGWGWGALILDVNHDGWNDIFETNGWDLPSYVGNLSRMFVNDGAGGFVDVAPEAGPLHNLHGLGALQFDLEGDGDQDIAITASSDELKLYRNDLEGEATAWLRVFLDTSARRDIAPNGVGAMVRATVGDATYTRIIGACSGFNTASELSAHFGLGGASVVDRLVVEWPNGEVTELTDVDANQTLTIDAPS